jgi:hypothetical protein
VRSGHDLDLYINGILIGTREIYKPESLSSVKTTLGDSNFNAIPENVYDSNNNENYGRYFDYKYYTKALSRDEIKDLAIPVKKLTKESDVKKGYGLDINISKGSKNLGSISL